MTLDLQFTSLAEWITTLSFEQRVELLREVARVDGKAAIEDKAVTFLRDWIDQGRPEPPESIQIGIVEDLCSAAAEIGPGMVRIAGRRLRLQGA